MRFWIKIRKKYLKEFKKIADDVFEIFCCYWRNVEILKNFIAQKVDEIPKPVFEVEVSEDFGAYDNDDSSFEIV